MVRVPHHLSFQIIVAIPQLLLLTCKLDSLNIQKVVTVLENPHRALAKAV
jgi:hypothetical protein